MAANKPLAVEVLRVWADPNGPQQLTLRTTWKDPAAWGLVLVDIARHAALAYEAEGYDRQDVFERILTIWNAEISYPTDDPQTLS